MFKSTKTCEADPLSQDIKLEMRVTCPPIRERDLDLCVLDLCIFHHIILTR